jgi:hypothetical protein
MIIYEPADLAGEYLAVGYIMVGEQGHWMINGSLLAMNAHYGCDVDDPNLAGKIAVVTSQGNASFVKSVSSTKIVFRKYSLF